LGWAMNFITDGADPERGGCVYAGAPELPKETPAEVVPTSSGTIHIELPGRALISLEAL
jgi:hypothetical protein